MIIPSIDLMGGRAVQLRRGESLEIDAGDPRPLAERFGRCGEIAVIDLDAARGVGSNAALIRELLTIAPCRVGGGIRSTDDALDWLDAGAARVILGTAATPEVLAPLPADRVIAALDARHGEVVVEGWTKRTGRNVPERIAELEGLADGFLITFVEVEGTLRGLPIDRATALIDAAGSARVTFAGGIRSPEELARLDRLGADVQVGMALYARHMTLGEAIAAPLRSDRSDGLWPTVIEDEAGRVLGLAWSSEASLEAALDEGRGIYQSRSRGLWRKGATSGATQTLVRVALDCDRDALLFTVRQEGVGFCHEGTPSCFDRPSAPRPFRISDLEKRLSDRLGSAPPGSLTARLAREPDLLTGKLLEEAGELATADSAAATTEEFADLLYFALVKLRTAGGSLRDVEWALERRARAVRRRRPREPETSAAGHDSARPAETRLNGASLPVSEATGTPLPEVSVAEFVRHTRREATDTTVADVAARIFEDVEARREVGLREHAERLGDLAPGDPLVLDRADLDRSLEAIDPASHALLERCAMRIRRFAEHQLDAIGPIEVDQPAGRAGHESVAVRAAGCYAPGGRYPLPSSALMTVIPARVAGVERVWVASPRPRPILVAAAALAGADGLLAVGGAGAIAALTFGVGGPPPCDIVVGPGNAYVTAAKRLAFGRTGIDMLAGPSELLVVAGGDADPTLVAADLLAQAEHDTDAVPLLCCFERDTLSAVRVELDRQLADLPTADVAAASLSSGAALLVEDETAAIRACDGVSAEHVQLHGDRAASLAPRLRSYGALFIGAASPEVAGDYGVGPNHTLPTSGTARFASGLSVFTFLRQPTWLELDETSNDYAALMADAAQLARLEGLEAHARAAEARIPARGLSSGPVDHRTRTSRGT
ncbi:MAG: histidinol dehydrogenase [Gemmatimonadetes bacterium]|nr:histidinol dehydrogenase [Gemmatimonadota bacterium]